MSTQPFDFEESRFFEALGAPAALKGQRRSSRGATAFRRQLRTTKRGRGTAKARTVLRMMLRSLGHLGETATTEMLGARSADGTEFLLSVHEIGGTHTTKPFAITSEGLRHLESAAKREAKLGRLAIFWTRWGLWTVLNPRRLHRQGNRHVLEMGEALKHNEMGRFGDRLIGTAYPMRLVVTHGDRPQQASIDVYCQSSQVQDPIERRLGVFLALFGRWPLLATHHDSAKRRIELVCGPEPDQLANPGQGFEFVGWLSEMFVRFYQLAILEGLGTGPNYFPGPFAEIFPPDARALVKKGGLSSLLPRIHEGMALPLWIMEQAVIDEPFDEGSTRDALDAIYATQDSALDPGLTALQSRSLVREDW